MNLELQRFFLYRASTSFLVSHSIPVAIFLSDQVYFISALPGRFVLRIEFVLERPRTLVMMTKPRFGEHVRHIRSLLDQESFL
jgi:NitT/TauT family transport system ATP-binding protein